ncbi:hypothetical protein EHQ92_18095 [Leptospira biflexa]|uniref:hypothetical protein n=1 Tax=Leptospira biflexa TaxID=172 RepID=UPI001090CD96|nr:hypothetical protein [Leptospira biflexa]TGM41710.1 hypothetical protein EHQ92_18095 [Leptospira biflexa]TGM43876.1 hypothetical protein EHQ88_18060 [Leptospira biflexa]
MDDSENKNFGWEIILGRFTDPFISTYITSWIIWNWKIIFLLFFDDKTASALLKYIDETYFTTGFHYAQVFGIPFIITIFWFYVFPCFKKHFVAYATTHRNKIEKRRLDIENDLAFATDLAILQRRASLVWPIEKFAIEMFTQLNKLDGQFEIRKCAGANVGDWVSINNEREFARLAYLNNDKTFLASGIVVATLEVDLVLIQRTGTVNAYSVGVSQTIKNRGKFDLYLSDSPGKFSFQKSDTHRYNQILCSFSGEGDNDFFSIELRQLFS